MTPIVDDLLPRLPSLDDVDEGALSHAPPQHLRHRGAGRSPRPMSTRSSSSRRLQAERVAKLRGDMRRERDAIAALRAEWATLDNPARIQGLARRHLQLRPAEAIAVRRASIACRSGRRRSCSRRSRTRSRTMIQDMNPVTGSVPALLGQTVSGDGRATAASRPPPVRRGPPSFRAAAGCARCSTAATSTAPPRPAPASASRSSPSPRSIRVIAVRLVMFAVMPESHSRGAPRRRDAIATARPDILDRNGADPRDRRAHAVAVRRAAQASSTSTRRSNC